MDAATPKSRITIITLAVSDLGRSQEFYEKIMGFELSRHSAGDFVMFETGTTRLALFPRNEFSKEAGKEMSPPEGFAFSYNVKSKEDVDGMMNHVKASGANITKDPTEEEWGGYSGYFEGPDGELWQVAFNPHFWLD